MLSPAVLESEKLTRSLCVFFAVPEIVGFSNVEVSERGSIIAHGAVVEPEVMTTYAVPSRVLEFCPMPTRLALNEPALVGEYVCLVPTSVQVPPGGHACTSGVPSPKSIFAPPKYDDATVAVNVTSRGALPDDGTAESAPLLVAHEIAARVREPVYP